MVREGDGKGMDGKGKGDGKGMVKGRGMDGEGMVKGMSSIHISIVSSLGHVTSSPSSHVSSSPLHCRCVSYRGRVVIPHRRCLIIIFAGVVIALSLLSLHVVLACPGHVVLVLAESLLSHVVSPSSCCV